ncbi:MAG: CapA family protein [Bacteroidales bacterium]|nr:CapA family protein [Bacteroidales bacterium]
MQKEKESIKMLFVGDTMFGWNIRKNLLIHGHVFPAEKIYKKLPKADFFCCNLETCISDRDLKAIKLKNDKIISPSVCLQTLQTIGIDRVSLANNHVFDFDSDGLKDTIEHLNRNNILYFGAGLSADEANAFKTSRIKGRNIGFLARTFTCEAANSGINKDNPQAAELLRKVLPEKISEHKKACDFLIVTLHFGFEYCEYPNYEDVIFCHKLVDAGADLIVCHHPHIVQGIEKYKNGLIAYSLGNFIFDNTGETDARTSKSFILDVILTMSGEKLQIENHRIIPTGIDHEGRAYLMEKDEKNSFMEKMNFLSEKIISEDFEEFSRSENAKVVYEIREKEIIKYLKKGNLLYLIKKVRNIKLIHLKLFIDLIKRKTIKQT